MRTSAAIIALALLVGLVIGLAGYTFIYAKGYSYLTNNPAACTNCHVMQPQYDAWIKSSHHSVATCNDCHTPHNLIGKYAVKANNGFWHSFYFTSGMYPDTIEITKFDHRVTENACRRCHENITAEIDGNVVHGKAEGLECTRCHNSVGTPSPPRPLCTPCLSGAIMTIPETDSEHGHSRRLFIAVIALAAVATVAVTALLVNIFERKQEAKNPFYRVVELNDTIDDPATWAKNFPMQYDLYTRTVDMQRTKYGGSEAMPHSPTEADPRSVVARSKLQEDPRLKTMWAGYAFSADYRERRGHAYMLEDQTFTERQKFNPPAMCINCHASMVTTFLTLGDGDITKGFNVISDTHMTYKQIRQTVKHPVACIDCHDPKNMQLRITRPAFIEGIRALKASQGVQNYDVNSMATRQEMRSYVCGQCHVTYYFAPPNKRLTFPWAKGLKVENIIEVEDEAKIKEWDHPDSGAGLIKARHPEFEMWNQGVHARSGVACADCHMPYMRQGGLKISDHQINSPLLKVNRSCQTCHHFPEEELKARVEDIQDRFFNLRSTALDALVDLINDIRAEKAKGATDAQLTAARDYQRKGQFMIDFVMSENSMGFHAPQEATRILGDAINLCRLGQLTLHGGPEPSHNAPNIGNIAPGPVVAPTRQSKQKEKPSTVAQLHPH